MQASSAPCSGALCVKYADSIVKCLAGAMCFARAMLGIFCRSARTADGLFRVAVCPKPAGRPHNCVR